MSKKLFLLDAAGFVFRAYCALPVMNAPSGETVQAVFGWIRSFNKLCKDFAPDYLVAVFDGPDNKKSRRRLYSDYKANRVLKYPDLPGQIESVKEYCRLVGIKYLDIEGVEADDVIASLVKAALPRGFEIFILTSDKDLCQLVEDKVSIINPWKKNFLMGREEVKAQFGVAPEHIPDYLALVGDSSDNIPGLPGCGPKGAAALLAEFGSVSRIIEESDKILSQTRRNSIREYKDQILLSRELANLNRDIFLGVSDEDLFFDESRQDQSLLNAFYSKLGFKSLISNEVVQEDSSEEFSPCTVKIIGSQQEAEEVLNKLTQLPDIASVTAYTGTIPTDLQLHGVALSNGAEETYFFPIDLLNLCRDSVNAFFKNNSLIAYENKYDKHALFNWGVQEITVSFDIVLAAYLLQAERGYPSLSFLISHYLLINDERFFSRDNGRNGLPVSDLMEDHARYFGVFAYYVSNLKKILTEKLESSGLTLLFQNLEMPLSLALFEMERTGMPFNRDQCYILSDQIQEELGRVTAEIYRLAGEEFNIKSPKQLGAILFDKLYLPRSKKNSTNVEVLENLTDQHPIIPCILEFRILEKLRSSYLMSLLDRVDPQDGRIHCTFVQTVTATGRLACRDPNLQNIPVRSHFGKKVREVFQPFSGDHVFVAADYSQIELRFLAHFSGDANLKKAFIQGEDIHSHTASEIFSVSLKEVTEEQRHQAKAVNFGIIYGQQAFGLAKTLKISLKKAQDLIDTYFRRYPKLESFISETLAKVESEGKVKTILGRIRGIDSWSKSFDKALSGRLAINTLLQGSAADLIKKSMLQIRQELLLSGLKAKMVLQIHDELIFEVPFKELEILIRIAKEKMESAIALEVPLLVNILIGKNWSEC